MREPVNGDEDESAGGRSIRTESNNEERASLGETPLDDDQIESIRRDNTWELAIQLGEMT